MSKTASSIQTRNLHRLEYERTMRRIVVGSVVLWFVLAFLLADLNASQDIVPMSIILAVCLVVVRVAMWTRYRRDMRAELTQKRG